MIVGNGETAHVLRSQIEKDPDSEVAPLARDMIALVGQGREVVNAVPVSSINLEREAVIVSEAEYAEAIERAGFEYNPEDSHLFIISINGTEQQKNAVLFAIADYNFSRFMIKDFDFKVKTLEDDLFAISVFPLSSLNEAVWYQNSVLADPGVAEALKGVKTACIGPVTADTAKSLGIEPDIIAKEYTIDGLVEAICK